MYKKDVNNFINQALIISFSSLLLFFAVMILKFSSVTSKAIVNSTYSCLTVIIPSLFAFMVISNIIILSNAYAYISKPFYLISKYLLRIPPELFSVFLISNLAGYPVGAKLITDLFNNNKISKKDAETMLCYCFASGPAFIIGAIGIIVFSSVLVGLIIFSSIILSNLFIGIIIGFSRTIPKKTTEKIKLSYSSNMLVDSIESASKSLALICGMIVFFSVIISICDEIGIISFLTKMVTDLFNISSNNSNSMIKAFFEISNISQISKYSYSIFAVITGIISFGGICVIMQLIGIIKKRLSIKLFLITRPLQVFLSAVFSYILINMFAKPIVIQAIISPLTIRKGNSIFPSILLIIMTILLLSLKKSSISKKGVI